MKTPLLLLLVTLTTAFKMVQQKNHVVFFGDSITEAGVAPGGYITVLKDLLNAKGKGEGYLLSGAGIKICHNKKTTLYFLEIRSRKPALLPEAILLS